MKKKKLFLSLLLVLTLVLVLLPGLQTETEAAAASSITVNGYDLPSGYYLPTATWAKTTTKPSGSYFYYSSGTLTIYNVTLSGTSGTRAVYAEGDLVVNLSGTNKLTTTNAYGIRATGTLKFTGSGSLTVNSGGYDAIYSSGNMEFAQTGTVTTAATGTSASGVECGAKLTIGGNLTATAESSYAIFASGDISMTQGVVNATGNCTYSVGAIRSNGAMTVSGGTLNVTSKSDGIISKYDFWQKAGNVTVNADWNGIIVETATNDARMSEGTLTVTAVRDGIKARKFFMNGGRGYIKSTNTASDSSYYAVKLAENTSSYFYMQGNVKASGSTTTSSSGLTSLTYANLPTYDYVFFTGYIHVNGVELRDGSYLQSGKTITNTVKPTSGGYAYYSGNTLTLNNYEGSNTSATGIYSQDDLNIVLSQGSVNKVTTSTTNGTTYRGIRVSGALKISGLGQLTISGGQYAIYSTGTLTIGTSVIKTYGSGIYSGSTINLNGATLDMTNINSYSAMACAIKTNYNMYIDGGAIVIYAPNNVTLSGASSSVGVTGISANYIDTSGSMGLEVSGDAISCSTKVYIHGGTLDFVVKKNYTSGINAKEISISNGTLNFSGESEGFANYGLYATDKITISGGTVNVDFEEYSYAMKCEADIAISGGVVNVEAYRGINAAYGNLNISGGTINVSTSSVALYAGKATFTGGMAMFRNTKGTGLYGMASVSSSTFVVGDGVAAIASEDSSGKNYELLKIANLHDYNYIAIGKFVMLHDVVLPTGHYLPSGNSSKTVSTTVPSSGDYAYYEHGVLTLCDYEYSGNSVAVRAFADLTVELVGNSKINHITSNAGDLTVKGTGSLQIKQNMVNDAVNVPGTVYVQSGLLTVDSSSGNGIACNQFNLSGGTVNVTNPGGNGIVIGKGNLTITGGEVNVTALNNAISVPEGRLNMSDGFLAATSTNTTTQELYYSALDLAGSSSDYYNVSGALAQGGTKDGTNTGLTKLDPKVMDNFDYVQIGRFIEIGGVTVRSGQSINGSGTLKQGNGGSGYAYYVSEYSGNTLTLNGYRFDGVSRDKTGLIAYSDLTVRLTGNSSITTGNLYAIHVCGKLTVTDTGTLTVTSSTKAMIVEGGFTFNGGTMNVESQNQTAMVVSEDFIVAGGSFTATSGADDAIYVTTGNLTVTGGFLKAFGYHYGIYSNDVAIRGGNMIASCKALVSSESEDDAHYAVYANSFTYLPTMYAAGSEDGSLKDVSNYNSSKRRDYDYIYVGDYACVGGILVPEGYYLAQGSTMPTTAVNTSSYVYYKDGELTMVNYTFSGKRSIWAPHALELSLLGANNYQAAAGNCINMDYDLKISGTGSLTCKAGSSSALVFTNSSLTIDGATVSIDARDYAILADNNVTVNSGKLTCSNMLKAENLTIKGGETVVESATDGVDVQKFVMTGGKFKTISSNTENDTDFLALRASSVDLSGIGSYVKLGSEDPSGSDIEVYQDSNRNGYDYVRFEPLVIKVNGVEISDGDYLIPGGTKAIAVLPTGTGAYAQRVGNKLNLVNYTYNGDLVGIESNGELNLVVMGTNSFSTNGSIGIKVGLGMTVSGSGKLTLTGKDTNILCHGDLSISVATLKLTSNSYAGISLNSGDFTMNSGDLDIYAQYDGINADHVTFNGGTALIRSSNMTNDSSYAAIWANGITVDSGLKVLGATDHNGFMALDIDTSKLTTYDYIKVQERTTPAPDNITVKIIGKAVTYTVSGNVVTVTHDKPCKLGYLGSDGKYVTLKGTKNSDGSYSFTAPAGVTEVLLGVKGDISGDGRINVGDVSKLYAHVKQTSPLSGDILFLADVSGDGRINVGDVSKLYANVKQTAPLTWDT